MPTSIMGAFLVAVIQHPRPRHIRFYPGPLTPSLTDSQVYRTLNIIDEFMEKALVIHFERKLNPTGLFLLDMARRPK
jgi:hypothetical protein